MVEERGSTAFKPEVHGFNFENGFPREDIAQVVSEDIIQEVFDVSSLTAEAIAAAVRYVSTLSHTWGLCGGMCLAALDRYFASPQESIPDDTSAPQIGSALFRELVLRQLSSLLAPGLVSGFPTITGLKLCVPIDTPYFHEGLKYDLEFNSNEKDRFVCQSKNANSL